MNRNKRKKTGGRWGGRGEASFCGSTPPHLQDGSPFHPCQPWSWPLALVMVSRTELRSFPFAKDVFIDSDQPLHIKSIVGVCAPKLPPTEGSLYFDSSASINRFQSPYLCLLNIPQAPPLFSFPSPSPVQNTSQALLRAQLSQHLLLTALQPIHQPAARVFFPACKSDSSPN